MPANVDEIPGPVREHLNGSNLQGLGHVQFDRELFLTKSHVVDANVTARTDIDQLASRDKDWQTRVRALKDEYIKRVQYEKESQELETLEGQLGATDKITREFKVQVRQEFTCMLCYESDVKLFLDPCGHMTCTACWSKVAPITPETKKCPCCRTEVKAKKIYLV
mgnify:CR=1 FL=1